MFHTRLIKYMQCGRTLSRYREVGAASEPVPQLGSEAGLRTARRWAAGRASSASAHGRASRIFTEGRCQPQSRRVFPATTRLGTGKR